MNMCETVAGFEVYALGIFVTGIRHIGKGMLQEKQQREEGCGCNKVAF